MNRTLCFATIVVITTMTTLLSTPQVAFAHEPTQPSPPQPQPQTAASSAMRKAAADVLFTEAEKLFGEGNHKRACAKYLESQHLDPQLGTLLHLADCYETIGLTASAWARFREGMELAAARGDVRQSVASERANALDARLMRVRIVIVPENDVEGLEVRLDGEVVGRPLWSIDVPVDPGDHEITAKAPGNAPWAKTIAPNEPRTTITIPVFAKTATAAASPRSNVVEGDAHSRGYVIGGVGLVTLVVGGALAIVTESKSNKLDEICPSGRDCTPNDIKQYDSSYSTVQDYASASHLTLVAGAALLLAGVAIVIFNPSAPSLQRSAKRTAHTPWKIDW